MKVLFIPSWYPNKKDPFYGIFVKEQVLALAASKISVSVLYVDSSYKKIFNRQIVEVNQEDGISVYRLGGFSFPKINKWALNKWVNQYLILYELYEKDHGTPDIIHAHSFVAAYAATIIKKNTNRPLIVTEHFSGLLKKTVKRRYLEIANHTYNSSNGIIAVGSLLKERISMLTSTRVVQMSNSFNPRIFYPPATKRPKKGIFKILGVGSFIERKGFEILIQACGQLIHRDNKKIELTLVGTGPLKNRYLKLIKNLKITESVNIREPLNRKEVANLMRTTHLFCLPSFYETFGVVLIEALACGTPVIASGEGGPQEIVNKENGLLFRTGKVEELEKAINYMFINYEKYDGEQLALATKAKYGQDRIVNELLNFYKTFL